MTLFFTQIFSVKSNPRLIWFCFSSLYKIGPENSLHFINQSDSKLKPIATGNWHFPAVEGFQLFIFSSLLIGCCDFHWIWFYNIQLNGALIGLFAKSLSLHLYFWLRFHLVVSYVVKKRALY